MKNALHFFGHNLFGSRDMSLMEPKQNRLETFEFLFEVILNVHDGNLIMIDIVSCVGVRRENATAPTKKGIKGEKKRSPKTVLFYF